MGRSGLVWTNTSGDGLEEKGRWVAARCTDVQGPANRRPATSAMVWVWAELGLRIRFEVCARGCAFFSLLAA